jgi:hypothetical protein
MIVPKNAEKQQISDVLSYISLSDYKWPKTNLFLGDSTSRTLREFIFGNVTIGFVCFSTHPRRTQDGFKSARHVDNKPYFIDVKHV